MNLQISSLPTLHSFSKLSFIKIGPNNGCRTVASKQTITICKFVALKLGLHFI